MEMAFVLSSSTPTLLTATSRRSRASSGSNDGKLLWKAHFAGIEREYCQIEKLANHLSSPAVQPVTAIQSEFSLWWRA
jgi:hypothetical protein